MRVNCSFLREVAPIIEKFLKKKCITGGAIYYHNGSLVIRVSGRQLILDIPLTVIEVSEDEKVYVLNLSASDVRKVLTSCPEEAMITRRAETFLIVARGLILPVTDIRLKPPEPLMVGECIKPGEKDVWLLSRLKTNRVIQVDSKKKRVITLSVKGSRYTFNKMIPELIKMGFSVRRVCQREHRVVFEMERGGKTLWVAFNYSP